MANGIRNCSRDRCPINNNSHPSRCNCARAMMLRRLAYLVRLIDAFVLMVSQINNNQHRNNTITAFALPINRGHKVVPVVVVDI